MDIFRKGFWKMSKMEFIDPLGPSDAEKLKKQAGAELCQAQTSLS